MNSREAFENLIEASPQYAKLRFMHGEKLFIKEGEQYKIVAVQLAWEAWQEQQKVIDAAHEVLINWVGCDFNVDLFYKEMYQALRGGQ